MKNPLYSESREEFLRNYKSPIDFRPDPKDMKRSVEHLPPVSDERAAFLMRGKKPETTIQEDAAELRDVAKAFVASIESNGTEAKRYGQVVRDWLDGCRARAIAKRGSESV